MTCRCGDCADATDPLKPIREGSNQDRRAAAAPTRSLVTADERRPEHAMAFAAAYAKHLAYFDLDDNPDGTWQEFFASDVTARLAVIAVEDIAVYRTTMKGLLGALRDPEPPASVPDMTAALGTVFDCIGALARRLDEIQIGLPAGQALGPILGNLIRSRLGPALRRLIGYYLAGAGLGLVDRGAEPSAHLTILGRAVEPFETLLTGPGLGSASWPEGVALADWDAFATVDPADYRSGYGLAASAVDRINHLATHNLFTAACEAFLAAHAAVVDAAEAAVRETSSSHGHEPHYALFLAFLELFGYAREEVNTLGERHLDFYYRRVLRLRERPARPAQAHVLVELAKHVESHVLAEGSLLKAGKDDAGADAHFAVDRELVANGATVTDLRRVYRHPDTEPLGLDHGRIFADAPAIDAASWHPFAERNHRDGVLTDIAMPPAEVGFAIASHYLWMAEGERRITVRLATAALVTVPGGTAPESGAIPVRLRCRLTAESGWIEREVESLSVEADGGLVFDVDLGGGDPPVTPYDRAIHGYGFATSMPLLVVSLRHDPGRPWDYGSLAGFTVHGIELGVEVTGVRTLALSNDHGTIDGSKPFLPFGSAPVPGSALLVGSREAFQKAPERVTVRAQEMVTPVPSGTTPVIGADYLSGGVWADAELEEAPGSPGQGDDPTRFTIGGLAQERPEIPDLTPAVPFATTTRSGFVRLVLSAGFGTDAYPLALAKWITDRAGDEPLRPVLPLFGSVSLDYTARQAIDPAAPSEGRGRFFHLTPFGHAEQEAAPGAGGMPLLPRFLTGSEPTEAELCVGLSGLRPPQDVALLFQVDDGTANPLVVKPEGHLSWSYLRGNRWVPFPPDAVSDGTDGLLASGVVTLAVPADATDGHTVLPSGPHWIRLAVSSASDAVCRLRTVAAQAMAATSVTRVDDGTPAAVELPPGTITKPAPADAAVKSLAQPFAAFGGRPVESDTAFAARVGERLRHKNRAITLWDHEHLVLEAFPAIYQARCLNHTQYEPGAGGAGIYRELAPGHVTVVTIPDLAVPDPRDPLRPYTSLRVLGEIERFLAARMSCFARLHVRNPQFEEVRTDLRVRFRDNVDETFHANRLRREIAEFLSPWAYRGGTRPTFNGTVHRSVLVDFLEDRDYVDYVSDVRLFHRLPGAGADGPDLEQVVGSRAISILVSVPPALHGVHPIHPGAGPAAPDCGCASVVA